MIAATPDAISRAKTFALSMWRRRAEELGLTRPDDLSDACKFCALFAQTLFGGSIEAHDFHCWILVDGRIVDLAEDGGDVRDLADGRIPTKAREYARCWGVSWNGDDPYEPDPAFMRQAAFIEAMESCRPRATRWSDEWRRLQTASAD